MWALLLTACALSPAAALDILVVSTMSSPSHHIWMGALTGGLLQRGHLITELVMRSPAFTHANRTSFVITGKTFAEQALNLEETYQYSVMDEVSFLYGFARTSTKIALESEAFAELVRHLENTKSHFDVIVIDYVLQEALLGLNYLAGRKPVVAATAYNMPEEILALMGSPFFPSLLPMDGVGADGGLPMSFWERAHNMYKTVVYKLYIYWSYRPYVEDTLAKTFPGCPSLSELEKDVALSLVNTSPALHGAMPLVPGIVEVGGLQARAPKPLPEDIRDWVDNAPHGFVLMSFGTNVRSASISRERRYAILTAFSRIPQRVLWKYEDDILDLLPKNVRVVKWVPQNDLLAHPNIRCFVSHNGGLSSQEASYHGVPVVGVPFFADQFGYAHKFQRLGLGRRVYYNDITEHVFHEALTDVIENPRYRDNMQRVRRALRDQKETPLERAVWWVEHVGRTGGAPWLRSTGLHLRWYQLWMLDLLAAACVAVCLAASLLRCILPRKSHGRDLKWKTH